jgi:hypothetical protein
MNTKTNAWKKTKNTTKFGIIGTAAATLILAGVTVEGIIAASDTHEQHPPSALARALPDLPSSSASDFVDRDALLRRISAVLPTDPTVVVPIAGGPGAASGGAPVTSGPDTRCSCTGPGSGSASTAAGDSTATGGSTGSGSATGTAAPVDTGGSGPTGASSSGTGTSVSSSGTGATQLVTGATGAVGATIDNVVSGVAGLLGH